MTGCAISRRQWRSPSLPRPAFRWRRFSPRRSAPTATSEHPRAVGGSSDGDGDHLRRRCIRHCRGSVSARRGGVRRCRRQPRSSGRGPLPRWARWSPGEFTSGNTSQCRDRRRSAASAGRKRSVGAASFLIDNDGASAEAGGDGAKLALSLNAADPTGAPTGYGLGSYASGDGIINFSGFVPNGPAAGPVACAGGLLFAPPALNRCGGAIRRRPLGCRPVLAGSCRSERRMQQQLATARSSNDPGLP